MQLGEEKAADEIVHAALVSPSGAQKEFEFAVLDAQFELYQHPDEAKRRLAQAEAALAKLKDDDTRRDLEAQWCSASLQLLVLCGLPDRAQPIIARELELAHELLARGLSRRRLDDALKDFVSVHLDLLEYEEVVQLLRRPNADLPPPDSGAGVRLEVREAMARAGLEAMGKTPADEAAREPVALLEHALASGLLFGADQELALTTEIQTLLDRGDIQGAEREFARLNALPAARAESRSFRFVDGKLLLEIRLELLRGNTAELPALLERVRAAWGSFIENWSAVARTSPELALLHDDQSGKLADGLLRIHIALEGPERGAEAALGELLRAQAAAPLAQAMGVEIPSTQALRESLVGADELALLHMPVREEGRVLAIDRAGVRVYALPSLPLIWGARRALARELDSALSEPNGSWDAVDRAARELEACVLPGDLLARIAQAKALAIVAPESVGYVPFELLPGPDGAPLGNSVAVRYLPSLPVGAALAARRARRTPTPSGPEVALLYADRPGAVPGAELAPLDARADELEALLAPYDETKREVRSGIGADRAGLLALLEHRPRVLQVIAHGHLERELVRPAELVLAGDTPLLHAEEVERLSAPPLVLLAACGAWEGPRRRGDDGRAHLPSAFLLAGADTVVAAESALLLEPSLAFFGVFHRALRAGSSPAHALMEARREIDSKAPTRRERVLAQLVHAIGLADEPLFSRAQVVSSKPIPAPAGEPGSLLRPSLALGTLALVAGVFFLLRRRARGQDSNL